MPVQELESLEECERICTQTPNQIIVLDFSAVWCGPCKRIYPLLQQLSQEYPNVLFYKVDIDELADVAEHFGISSVPSFKFIHNNKIVAEFSGADAQKLQQTLQELTQQLTNN